MNESLFDTHVHFDGLCETGQTLEDVVRRAADAGVDRMLAVGGSPAANRVALDAAARFPDRIAAAVGFDRDRAAPEHGDGEPLPDPAGLWDGLDDGDRCLRLPVAVGEIGLDFHYAASTAGRQTVLFRSQLLAAGLRSLPVIVHSREAERETLEELTVHVRNRAGSADRVGVLHCFTGSAQFLDSVLELGLYVSFSGIVTFRNADRLRELACKVPDDRLLIETDSPYLAPVPFRGRPNQPAYLAHVAELLAAVRGCAPETLAVRTTANARRLFGI